MLFRLLTQRLFQVVLLLLLLAGAMTLRYADPLPVQALRNAVFDHYNRVLPRKPGTQTVIADIDDESLRRIGQWPWPRDTMGDLAAALAELGAAATAFDILFAEPDRSSPAAIGDRLPATPELAAVAQALKGLPDNDAAFAERISAAGNVVLAFAGGVPREMRAPDPKAGSRSKGGSPLPFVTPVASFTIALPVLYDAAAGAGSINFMPGHDGLARYVPLLFRESRDDARDVYPGLALEAVRIATMRPFYSIGVNERGIAYIAIGEYQIPVDNFGRMLVYYAGHRPDIYIPAWKILARQVDAKAIKDKIVFVGTSAAGLLDLRSTPLDRALPGVEVHAEIAEQILNRQFLLRPLDVQSLEIYVTIAVALAIIFLTPFLGAASLGFFCAVAAAGGYFGALYMYQSKGWLLDPLYPALTIMVIFILSSILTNLRSEAEKRAIRAAFGHYISPDLLEELTSDPSKLRLGGEVRELSVMFTDIRNFTTISESMDPGELIRMMNDFLTPMTSAVLENRGTVDKYMGDAMMTFWNAPVDDLYHATNACKAAIEMVRVLAPVNDMLRARAAEANRTFHELKAGIGINSGRASVGNMGSRQRFAYSALGDTVNLASRLEGQTKAYGISVMISSETKRQAEGFAVIELDLLTVKGRAEPERVYALLGSPEEAGSETFRSFAALHEKMLAAYRAQDWDAAAQWAEECQNLRNDLAALYQLYLKRIAQFRDQPPGAGWDGVYVAKDK
ncbi:MAG TPA: adenylate/guanylate cyclase domain-containing protein [Patescibacteria group bacterium]|nr:adenylate/guanylate cyclase domain-containing protein [Patescibacteria group bacterium]